jgi:hypothetical protein
VSPGAYATLVAGHSSSAITDRYVHLASTLFPGAAATTEERLFGRNSVETEVA